MGYRSDVAIAIYNKDFEELCKMISKEAPDSEVRYLFDLADIQILGDDVPDSIVTIFWSDVKWYDSYKDVQFMMDFLHCDDMPYAFKRIGEDIDDTEDEYNNDDNWELNGAIWIERYIARSEGTKVDIHLKVDNNLSGESIDSGLTFDDMIGGLDGLYTLPKTDSER